VVFEIDEAGVATRLVAFDETDLEAATAELDELAERGSSGPIENAASRLGRRLQQCIVDHDMERFGALHEPEALLEDRRRGFLHVLRGADEAMAQARAMEGVTEARAEVLATRGDRTTLFRTVWAGETRQGGPFEVETLQLGHFSTADLLAEHYLFDSDDLEAAFEQLDELFIRDEAAGALNAWQVMQDVVRAHNEDDPELFAAQARDVETMIDHRRLGWGELRDGQFQRTARTLVDQSAMRCLAVPRIAPNGLVAVLGTSGTAPFGGGPWENDFVVVARIDGTTANHLEFFAPEQLDAAIARFDELTS
jgi:hypothetical protein